MKTICAVSVLTFAACGRAEPSPTASEEQAEPPTAASEVTRDAPTEPAVVEVADDVPHETPQRDHKIMIVLDSSGSMWGQIEGAPKRDIAAKTLANIVPSLDASADIGLVAYGHRRTGDCADIETILPAEADSRGQIVSRVSGLKSMGKTPLTAAVSKAADALALEDDKTTVILITDGIETCKADPCELGRSLEERGVDFTAHVVGFGLSADQGRQVSCLADETGGLYLNAQNAQELNEALETVSDDIVLEAEIDEPELGDANVKVLSPEVRAGAQVSVEWSGPQSTMDSLVVYHVGADEVFDRVYIYEKDAPKPASLRAPDKPGEYVVQYRVRHSDEPLALDGFTVVPATASVDAPDGPVIVGTYFDVAFEGDSNPGDKIVLYSERDVDEVLEAIFTENAENGVSKLLAPSEAGAYKVAYQTHGGGRLAVDSVLLIEPTVSVKGPDGSVHVDTDIDVAVHGVGGEFDKIIIVSEAAPDEVLSSGFVKNAAEGILRLRAPTVAGEYQLNYVKRDGSVLASDTLTLVAPEVSLKIIEQDVVAGAYFNIALEGAGGKSDRVIIVDPSNPKKSLKSAFVQNAADGVLRLIAPVEVGEYDLHWINKAREVLAETTLVTVAPDATLSLPDGPIKAGAGFEIGVSDRFGEYDKVLLVSPDKPGDAIESSYVSNLDGVFSVTTPTRAGVYEVRYINREDVVLNRVELIVAE